ncbi:MAG: DUF58 domain-containing protein [Spirochaetales bacterium]|nr:DUF58 domain-containing protein [Spirochaetales bacterium]
MQNSNLFSKVKNLSLVTSRLVEGLFSGNYRSVFKGPGLEFDEVREYVEGDDARNIDWNVSSRMDHPYSKTFKEEREIALFLIVDMSASLSMGSGENSKQQIISLVSALLAFAAVHNNDMVGAVFFTDRIEKWVMPKKGQKHVNRLIYDMMNFQPNGNGSDLALAIRTVYESVKRRGICIILSDFRTSPAWRELTLLSRKHDVIAINISDPIDMQFPGAGFIELVDPESLATLFSYGTASRFRKEYHDFWDTYNIYWHKEYRKRGINMLTIGTDENPVEKLLSYFRRRRRY